MEEKSAKEEDPTDNAQTNWFNRESFQNRNSNDGQSSEAPNHHEKFILAAEQCSTSHGHFLDRSNADLKHNDDVSSIQNSSEEMLHNKLESMQMNDSFSPSVLAREMIRKPSQEFAASSRNNRNDQREEKAKNVLESDQKARVMKVPSNFSYKSLDHCRTIEDLASDSIIEETGMSQSDDEETVAPAKSEYSANNAMIKNEAENIWGPQNAAQSNIPVTTLNREDQATKPNIRAQQRASLASCCTPTDILKPLESRPIYPNIPYSPYGSPYGSPGSSRRRAPLRESRRVSIEQSGSFLQLNQYKLLDQIGQGSYGLVKLAYSEEDSTHYAMKILSKKRLLRKAGLLSRAPKKATCSPLDRVYREIAVLKKLDHPNVVKLIEVLDDPLEDSLYLVFELVRQGEVLSIPTENPLPEERAWSVFRDALQGLEYLHFQRIIHSDIKPGNLLLTECGHVKIADLGVCNEFLGEEAIMNNGSTAGTPAFRAPETLIPGQHMYNGKAADVWALGATLYSLVFGNVPFVASSVPMLYEKIKNEPLVFPDFPKISAELQDCINCMLTRDPVKRITLPQLKVHPWVTNGGTSQLPSEDENCSPVQINDDDIHTVVRSIPKLDTLILIKTMLKKHSFGNPFLKGVSGRAPQRGGSRLERFSRTGRSNSAPGYCHMTIDRQHSSDAVLPSVVENGSNPVCDGAEEA